MNEVDEMVERHLVGRGVTDPLTLAAMRSVPRHRFVESGDREQAYGDHPLPIGAGQTISQPYIVALMTSLLGLKGGERVLEVGTGCGYQTAVLAAIAARVYTIEILPDLAAAAAARLAALGCTNVETRVGDGYYGWPEASPFGGILVTAAAREPPAPLIDQLEVGAALVLPIGSFEQELLRIVRTGSGSTRERIIAVRFVPMTGAAQARFRQDA